MSKESAADVRLFVENLPAEGDAIAGYVRNGVAYRLTGADLRALLAENERLRASRNEDITAYETQLIAIHGARDYWQDQMVKATQERNAAAARAEQAEGENAVFREWLYELGYDALSVAQRFRRQPAAAQHPAGGPEGDAVELACDSGVPIASAVSEGVSGAVRAWAPEEVPDVLWHAFLDAVNECWIKSRAADIERCCYQAGIAAVLTQLGLREEWGFRWHGARVEEQAEGYETEADARSFADPTDTIMHRYVTDWEER